MKSFVALCLMLGASLCLQAQTPPEPTKDKFMPPSIVSAKFSGTYPNTDPTWSSEEDEIFAAEYRVEETNMGRIVRYDRNGNLLSIDNEQANDAYPMAIGKYYVKKYPHEKYAIWSREENGSKMYYANRGREKVWFDKNGKWVSSKNYPRKGAVVRE